MDKQGPMHTTQHYSQYPTITIMEKNMNKNVCVYIYIYMYIIIKWLYTYIYCGQLHQLCLTLCSPMDYSLPDSSSMGFSRKNIGMGCHGLLQGIFFTRDANWVSHIWASLVAQTVKNISSNTSGLIL